MQKKYKASKKKASPKPMFLTDEEVAEKVKSLSAKYGINKRNQFVEEKFMEPNKFVFNEKSLTSLRPVILRDKYLLQYVTDVSNKRYEKYKYLTSQKKLRPSLDIFSARQRELLTRLMAVPARFCVSLLDAAPKTDTIMTVSSLNFVSRVVSEKTAYEFFLGKYDNMNLSETIKHILRGFAVRYDDIVPNWRVNTWMTALDPEWIVDNERALRNLGRISHWPIPLLMEYNCREGEFFDDIACYFSLKTYPIRSESFTVGVVKHPVPALMWGANVVFELNDIIETMKEFTVKQKFYWEKVLIATFFYVVKGENRYDALEATYVAGGGNLLYETCFLVPDEVKDFLDEIAPQPREIEEPTQEEISMIDHFHELLAQQEIEEIDEDQYENIEVDDVVLERHIQEELDFIASSEDEQGHESYGDDFFTQYDEHAEDSETEFSTNDRTATGVEIQFEDHERNDDSEHSHESVDSDESY